MRLLATTTAALLLLSSLASAYSPQQYMGDQVFSIAPSSDEQVQTLRLWQEKGLYGDEKIFLDFWSSASAPGREFQVHVRSADLQEAKNALDSEGIFFRVTNTNLGRLIELESEMNAKAFADHSKYLRYAEYIAAAGALVSKCGSQCSSEVIGKSIEGRDIVVYKLGSNSANPVIFLDCGIHAREWISPATLLYIMDQIISNPTHRAILNTWNLAVVGLANPDGYEYSHTRDRYWRKNRRSGSLCYGVDLNRNFGYMYGGLGTSPTPCSDIYRGTSAFSEPETQAIRDFVTRNKAAIKAFWSVHSYGQYWLHPYGYNTGVYPQNVNKQIQAANVGAEALRRVNGNRYSIGGSADLLYPAAGGSDDWAASIGIPYAYTVELPDTGRYGFVLPPNQIVPVGEETLAGLVAFLQAI